ncbi:hypothetical protein [Streptomyces sp. SID3343]|uniref:hypothetical protein n=1 Tax=Streptomyces sp. SID3343 TaxID=2690260 RepID=UPI00136D2512|nr:hypothetical protein [Streptomyces sp. SID3343]MYW01016.1 hypothetical protein [Streptomyces sp. SID3343]
MRRVRTLVAGSAIALAALTISAPAAFADDAPAPHNGASAPDSDSHEKSWTGEHKSDDGKSEDGKGAYGKDDAGGKGAEDKGGDASDGKSWKEHKSPHGGVHTGIGGSFLDDGAGLATGAALIAGGVGLGVYALRRRTSPAAAAATQG